MNPLPKPAKRAPTQPKPLDRKARLERKTPLVVVSRKLRRPQPDVSHQAVPKIVRERNEEFLDWIRGQACCLERHGRHTCRGRIDPSHLRSRGAYGPDSENVVPMCRNLHIIWHNMPREQFEEHFNLRVDWVARDYWRRFLKEKRT